jgi:hypothetical protein
MSAFIHPGPTQEYDTKTEYEPDQNTDPHTFYQNTNDQADHDGKNESRLSSS